MAHLTPHLGTGGDRAAALLTHEWGNEKIIDLCNQDKFGVTPGGSPGAFPPNPVPPGQPPTPPPYTSRSVLSNTRPPPGKSWLVWNATIELHDAPNVNTSVQIIPNKTQHPDFDPARPDTGFPVETEAVKRFIEDSAGRQTIIIRGYAERIGYPIPKPNGRITIGGARYAPIGKGTYAMKFEGMHFGVPKYSAAWAQEYRLIGWPGNGDPNDAQRGIK